MLILTRRAGENIVIAEDGEKKDELEKIATIAILGIKGNQVRIGINADQKYMIHREEVYERILREKHEKKDQDEELAGNI